ncbi:MAG: hypothetical protein ABJP25_10270 [Sneathiella sp.]
MGLEGLAAFVRQVKYTPCIPENKIGVLGGTGKESNSRWPFDRG